jgi:hypothetical protein
MNIIIIILILLFLYNNKEKFNNPKKIISKGKNIKNYLKEFKCDKFIFHDSHPVYNFNNKEILILLEPIIEKLNKTLSLNFYIYEILKVSKYLGGYYHVVFSAIDNFNISNFEIKFHYENKKIRIGMFKLYNSENDNLNGYDNLKFENNKINLVPNYSWMFDLSRGDMGMIPHTGNNRN